MHSGRIDSSERHMRLIRALKPAPYPLSAEDISEIVRLEIGRIPQAVSTTIGEMRSEDNRAAGYIVSFSTRWKEADADRVGRVVNGDGSITFFIKNAVQRWHDGRPRYYLIAAPHWTPTWVINEHGVLIVPHKHQIISLGNAQQQEDIFCRKEAFIPLEAIASKAGQETQGEQPVVKNTCNACGKELLPGPPWCPDNEACWPEWKRVSTAPVKG